MKHKFILRKDEVAYINGIPCKHIGFGVFESDTKASGLIFISEEKDGCPNCGDIITTKDKECGCKHPFRK